MPVTFDALGTASGSLTQSLTVNINIASNAVLVVGVGTNINRSASAILYAGVALTRLGQVHETTNQTVELWVLTAPAAGNNALSAHFVGASAMWAIAGGSYLNVKAIGPFGTPASGTSGTANNVNFSISSTTTDLVAGFIWGDNSTPSATNGTSRASVGFATGGGKFLYQDIAGAASITLSATSTGANWAFMGLPLIFSAAAVATTPWGLATMNCGA